MSAEKTLGLVLRVVEFSESSYIATLFTEDFGKITGLAKGARRPKSSFENALDLLAVSRVVFLRKSTDGMDLLTEARLERRFRAAARSLRRLYAGYYLTELLLSLTDERDPQPELFRMALRTRIALEESGDVNDELMRFELAMLHSLGQSPVLDRCVECGAAMDTRQRVAFGHLAGGALCVRCRPGQRHVVSLSANAAERLAAMTREVESEMNDGSAVAVERTAAAERLGADRSSTPSAMWGELRGLMNYRMQHAMGRRARVLSFLNPASDTLWDQAAASSRRASRNRRHK